MNIAENAITDFIEKKLAKPADAQSYDHLGNKDFMKGIIAGLAGGIVATAAKTLAEKVYPPRTHGEPEPTDVAAEKLPAMSWRRHRRPWRRRRFTGCLVRLPVRPTGRWQSSTRPATARDGANFGMTLMALTHEGALPAMGLSADPADQTTRGEVERDGDARDFRAGLRDGAALCAVAAGVAFCFHDE